MKFLFPGTYIFLSHFVRAETIFYRIASNTHKLTLCEYFLSSYHQSFHHQFEFSASYFIVWIFSMLVHTTQRTHTWIMNKNVCTATGVGCATQCVLIFSFLFARSLSSATERLDRPPPFIASSWYVKYFASYSIPSITYLMWRRKSERENYTFGYSFPLLVDSLPHAPATHRAISPTKRRYAIASTIALSWPF